MSSHTLGALVYAFFEDHLKARRGLQPASIKSYRDAMRLFLQFSADDAHRKITRLLPIDLTFERAQRFLQSLEEKRHNHIRTRNQRLAVLHTFFMYLATQIPEMLVEAERVAAIPSKRVAPPETHFLERDEIDTLFDRMPSSGPLALRDRTLLLFMYNTGARAQEVADLRTSNVELVPQLRVHLHGKGDKWRVCPLWQQTARLLGELLEERSFRGQVDRPVFTSARGRPLTRSGIYKIVRRHTKHLEKKKADASIMHISPHVFRHTTAVHLLEAGVEVNVIRAWLGHVSLETTNRYAEINIRMKEEALEKCEPPLSSSAAFPGKPVWRDDKTLLDWLESL